MYYIFILAHPNLLCLYSYLIILVYICYMRSLNQHRLLFLRTHIYNVRPCKISVFNFHAEKNCSIAIIVHLEWMVKLILYVAGLLLQEFGYQEENN